MYKSISTHMSSFSLIDGSLLRHSPDAIRLQTTNPRIVDFYSKHPEISFETVNMTLVELLENVSPNTQCTRPQLESAILLPEEKRKAGELNAFLEKIREAIRQQIQYISDKYITAKTEYIRDFQSTQNLTQNNRLFLEKVRSLLFAVGKIRHANIAEKSQMMLKKFEQILSLNADAILTKTENVTAENVRTTKEKEYLDNFESNATHMIQAIIQLLIDCAKTCEQRVNEMIDTKQDSHTAYYKLIYDLNDLLHQIPLSDSRSSGESFQFVLSQTFPTATINADEESDRDFVLLRSDKPSICIETHKMPDRNVNAGEVKQFIRSLEEQNMNGILISQHTGISDKPHFHIEIHSNRIVVYLHKMEYYVDKLQIAVDIIDTLTTKLTDFFFSAENKYSIPKETLDDVNREYQQFIIQKESILTMIKEQHKRLVGQIDEMRFASLDKFLSTRYSSCKKQGFVCDLCGIFTVGTLKGLAAHKRGCARKRVATDNTSTECIPVLKVAL